MSMYVSCPGCRVAYQLPENLVGQTIRCGRCAQVFRVEAGGAARKVDTAIQKEKRSSRGAQTQPRSPDDRPRPKRRSRSQSEALPWIIGGVIGGLSLLVCGLIVAVVVLARTPAPPAASNADAVAMQPAAPVGQQTFPAPAHELPERPIRPRARKEERRLPPPPPDFPSSAREEEQPPPPPPPDLPPPEPEAAPKLPLPPISREMPVDQVEPPAKGEDSIPLTTLEALKSATVFIKVDAGNIGASGSGFVISAQGDTALIVSNQHVVNPTFKFEPPALGFPGLPGRPLARPPGMIGPPFGPMFGPFGPAEQEITVKNAKITAVFNSGTRQERSYPATVLAADEEVDLAVLRVSQARNLPRPIDFSKEVKLVETMHVFTFGFPFGKKLSVDKSNPAITVGKASVSSIRRDKGGDLALVQIDGALNPGNSGGPIVDARGRLIGVAVAIIEGANNIGLAIPSRHLSQFVQGHAGTPELRVVPRDQKVLDIEVRVPLIDLWQRVNKATFLYRAGLPPPGRIINREDFASLPDTFRVPLQLTASGAAGRFALARPARNEFSLTYQLALTDAQGKSTRTNLTTRRLLANPLTGPGMDRQQP